MVSIFLEMYLQHPWMWVCAKPLAAVDMDGCMQCGAELLPDVLAW